MAKTPKMKRRPSDSPRINWHALAKKTYAVGLAALKALEPNTMDRGWDFNTPGTRKSFAIAIRYAVENANRPKSLVKQTSTKKGSKQHYDPIEKVRGL